jgi:hypothetical protein
MHHSHSNTNKGKTAQFKSGATYQVQRNFSTQCRNLLKAMEIMKYTIFITTACPGGGGGHDTTSHHWPFKYFNAVKAQNNISSSHKKSVTANSVCISLLGDFELQVSACYGRHQAALKT